MSRRTQPQEIPEPMVVEMAERVRAGYIQARRQWHGARGMPGEYDYTPGPQWDGGQTAYSRNYKAIWPKIARWLMIREIDPVVFVRLAFQREMKDPPTPTMLMSEMLVGLYRDYERNRPASFEAELRLQANIVGLAIAHKRRVSGWPDVDVYRHVLLTRGLGAGPLFRYATAYGENLTDVMAVFRDGAIIEYARSRELYDRVWGEFVPPDIRSMQLTNRPESANV